MCWPRILEELRKRHGHITTLAVIRDHLNNRTTVIRGNFLSVEKRISKGCPQGSILGTDLWNLVIDDLLNRIEFRELQEVADCDVVAYADKIGIVIAANSRMDLERTASNLGQLVADWCVGAELQLATEKTQMRMLRGELKSKDPVLSRQKSPPSG